MKPSRLKNALTPRPPAPRPGAVDIFAEHAPPAPPLAEQAVRLKVADLVLDERIQPRERVDPAKIFEYGELLREAAVEGLDQASIFDAALVVYVDEDGTLRVAEGFHRTGAARQVGAPELMAIIRPGGIAEARLWAAGSNNAHGLPRTAADKRRVLLWFLDDAKGQVTLTPEVLQRLPEPMRTRVRPGQTVSVSDHLIGYLCQVSQSTVTRLRSELRRERAGTAPATDAAHQSEPEKRLGLDGKERRVPTPKITRLFKESLFPEEEEDLAARRRHEDAGPRRPKAPAPAKAPPKPAYPPWPLAEHQTHAMDWRARGKAFGESPRAKKLSPDDLRRGLAFHNRELLSAVAWGALAAGGDGAEARDEALALLFEGAKKGVRRG